MLFNTTLLLQSLVGYQMVPIQGASAPTYLYEPPSAARPMSRPPYEPPALSSERAARSPTPLNPAGFEPRIPRVPNSGLMPCVSPVYNM